MQFTFDIDDTHVPRLRAWMLSKFATEDDGGVPLPVPTDAEIMHEFKRAVRRFIRDEVQQYELIQERERIHSEYTQITVTDV